MCFGINIVNKVNDLPKCVQSAQSIESILNKPTPKKENPTAATNQSVKKISNTTNVVQAPQIVESAPTNVPFKKENSSVAANQIGNREINYIIFKQFIFTKFFFQYLTHLNQCHYLKLMLLWILLT